MPDAVQVCRHRARQSCLNVYAEQTVEMRADRHRPRSHNGPRRSRLSQLRKCQRHFRAPRDLIVIANNQITGCALPGALGRPVRSGRRECVADQACQARHVRRGVARGRSPLARACRGCLLRICTDKKINVVDKPQRLLIANKNARSTISRTVDGRPQHQCLEGVL